MVTAVSLATPRRACSASVTARMCAGADSTRRSMALSRRVLELERHKVEGGLCGVRANVTSTCALENGPSTRRPAASLRYPRDYGD